MHKDKKLRLKSEGFHPSQNCKVNFVMSLIFSK